INVRNCFPALSWQKMARISLQYLVQDRCVAALAHNESSLPVRISERGRPRRKWFATKQSSRGVQFWVAVKEHRDQANEIRWAELIEDECIAAEFAAKLLHNDCVQIINLKLAIRRRMAGFSDINQVN